MANTADTAKRTIDDAERATEKHLGDAARAAKEAIDWAFGKARSTGRRTAETVGETVESHPFYSLVVAFLAGLLIGALIGRR